MNPLSPRRPNTRENSGRPATQREAVRRTLSSWRFMTAESVSVDASPSDVALVSRAEARAHHRQHESLYAPHFANLTSTSRPHTRDTLRSSVTSVTIASRPATRESTTQAVQVPLLEYSPDVASGGTTLDATPTAGWYAPGRQCLSLQSVLNEAVESAEALCIKIMPSTPEEIARRLLQLPPTEKPPHSAAVTSQNSPNAMRLDGKSALNTTVGSRASAVLKPSARPVPRFIEGLHAAPGGNGSSALNHSPYSIEAALKALDARRQRKAVDHLASSLSDTQLSIPSIDMPQLTTARSEEDITSQTTTEKRVHFEGAPRRRKIEKPQALAALTLMAESSPRRSSTGRRGTESARGSSRATTPGGTASPRAAVSPTSSISGPSTTREWVAAGGVSKDEPIYKVLSAAIEDVKHTCEFEDPREIEALDNVLLGLQHAHVHRIYPQMHSLNDVSATFREVSDAPVAITRPFIMLATDPLRSAKRAAIDVGGRRGERLAQAGPRVPPAPRNEGATDPRAKRDSERRWAGEIALQRQLHEWEETQRKERNARFLMSPSQLKTSDGPIDPHGHRPTLTATAFPAIVSPRNRTRASDTSTPSGRSKSSGDQFSVLLKDKTIAQVDDSAHGTLMQTSAAIQNASELIADSVAHLRRVMPSEYDITYPVHMSGGRSPNPTPQAQSLCPLPLRPVY
jgi:hypothetical protein